MAAHRQAGEHGSGRGRGRTGRGDGPGVAEVGLYTDPEIYDILHAPGTNAEVATFVHLWNRLAREAPKTALEPACGTGRCLQVLRRRGFRVRGFDISLPMIRYARRRHGLGSAVFVAGLDDFAQRIRPGSIGLALCPINSIRHVASDAEMIRHLRAVARVLHPGGVYAVGISLSAYGLEAPTEDVWRGSRAGVGVKQIVSYTPAAGERGARRRAENVVSVLEVRRGRKVDVRSSSYSLLSYSRGQWESVIGRSGLRVLGIVNEQSRNFDPGAIGYAIWVLARPEHPLLSEGN
ncbi:MAG: class I SAM-dependent methyltransferase [Planctomycetes bacterium]|nr:class I SAM-dependent methyltransferase [Planctomycetota bacterium]